jgi:hypothetical protein
MRLPGTNRGNPRFTGSRECQEARGGSTCISGNSGTSPLSFYGSQFHWREPRVIRSAGRWQSRSTCKTGRNFRCRLELCSNSVSNCLLPIGLSRRVKAARWQKVWALPPRFPTPRRHCFSTELQPPLGPRRQLLRRLPQCADRRSRRRHCGQRFDSVTMDRSDLIVTRGQWTNEEILLPRSTLPILALHRVCSGPAISSYWPERSRQIFGLFPLDITSNQG